MLLFDMKGVYVFCFSNLIFKCISNISLMHDVCCIVFLWPAGRAGHSNLPRSSDNDRDHETSTSLPWEAVEPFCGLRCCLQKRRVSHLTKSWMLLPASPPHAHPCLDTSVVADEHPIHQIFAKPLLVVAESTLHVTTPLTLQNICCYFRVDCVIQ